MVLVGRLPSFCGRPEVGILSVYSSEDPVRRPFRSRRELERPHKVSMAAASSERELKLRRGQLFHVLRAQEDELIILCDNTRILRRLK